MLNGICLTIFLYNTISSQVSAPISIGCQHVVHKSVMKLMDNKNLEAASAPICKQDVINLNCPTTDQTGQLLSCVLDHIEDLNPQCQVYFQLVERIAFSDFRVFSKFMTDCADDIELQKCGRLEADSSVCIHYISCCFHLILFTDTLLIH